jgi:hypothetical protein
MNLQVMHPKYGRVTILEREATDKGGLALIETADYGSFWIRAAEVGPALWT